MKPKSSSSLLVLILFALNYLENVSGLATNKHEYLSVEVSDEGLYPDFDFEGNNDGVIEKLAERVFEKSTGAPQHPQYQSAQSAAGHVKVPLATPIMTPTFYEESETEFKQPVNPRRSILKTSNQLQLQPRNEDTNTPSPSKSVQIRENYNFDDDYFIAAAAEKALKKQEEMNRQRQSLNAIQKNVEIHEQVEQVIKPGQYGPQPAQAVQSYPNQVNPQANPVRLSTPRVEQAVQSRPQALQSTPQAVQSTPQSVQARPQAVQSTPQAAQARPPTPQAVQARPPTPQATQVRPPQAVQPRPNTPQPRQSTPQGVQARQFAPQERQSAPHNYNPQDYPSRQSAPQNYSPQDYASRQSSPQDYQSRQSGQLNSLPDSAQFQIPGSVEEYVEPQIKSFVKDQDRDRKSTYHNAQPSSSPSAASSRKSIGPSSSRISRFPSSKGSDLNGIKLGFCDAATLGLIVNIRLLALKFPRQTTSNNERLKISKYLTNLITNFPCDYERELMNEELKAMPPMFSDRNSFNRWVDIFSRKILKRIDSPVGINLGSTLVPIEQSNIKRK